MAKIIGNTTATPSLQSDWLQTDATKADYIKNKPIILTEADVKKIVGNTGGGMRPVSSSVANGILTLTQFCTYTTSIVNGVLMLAYDGPMAAWIEDGILKATQKGTDYIVYIDDNILIIE